MKSFEQLLRKRVRKFRNFKPSHKWLVEIAIAEHQKYLKQIDHKTSDFMCRYHELQLVCATRLGNLFYFKCPKQSRVCTMMVRMPDVE